MFVAAAWLLQYSNAPASRRNPRVSTPVPEVTAAFCSFQTLVRQISRRRVFRMRPTRIFAWDQTL